MAASHFKVKSKIKLSELNIGDRVDESDYAQLTNDGYFVQLEHVDGDETPDTKYHVKPGVFTIKNSQQRGMYLDPTSYVRDTILEEIVSTQDIATRIDKFFNKFDVYRKHGFEIPKRGILLYGPPGTGKTTSIAQVAHTYGKDGKTLIVTWATDKYEAFHVRDFFNSFAYDDAIERVVLVVEDIGGVEIDQVRMKSDSSLLALLDNQEKIFKKPILILATTNFPEVFMGNLTNRPNRFDDKIKVDYPNATQRVQLLEFFAKKSISDECKTLMTSKRCDEFSAAHIREVVIRPELYDIPMETVIVDMCKEIETYKKNFEEKGRPMGFGDD